MVNVEPSEFGSGSKELAVTVAWVTGRQILRCVCTGQASIEGAVRLLDRIADEPVPPQSCLLLDLLGVGSNLAIRDRHTLGLETAKALAKFRRVAIVQEPGPYNGFGAFVARNRGANVAVFRSEADAMRWLS